MTAFYDKYYLIPDLINIVFEYAGPIIDDRTLELIKYYESKNKTPMICDLRDVSRCDIKIGDLLTLNIDLTNKRLIDLLIFKFICIPNSNFANIMKQYKTEKDAILAIISAMIDNYLNKTRNLKYCCFDALNHLCLSDIQETNKIDIFGSNKQRKKNQLALSQLHITHCQLYNKVKSR